MSHGISSFLISLILELIVFHIFEINSFATIVLQYMHYHIDHGYICTSYIHAQAGIYTSIYTLCMYGCIDTCMGLFMVNLMRHASRVKYIMLVYNLHSNMLHNGAFCLLDYIFDWCLTLSC
mgnify:CR=1 FL=1